MPKIEDDSAVIENIVDGAVESLKNKVADLESKINGIDSTLKNSTSSVDLDNLYSKLKAEMPKIEDDSAVIENIVDGAVESLKTKVTALEDKINGIDSTLKNSTSSADLDNLYSKLKAEMPKIEDDSAVIENIVDGAVESLKTKVVALESKINGIDSTLKNAASSTDLDNLYSKLKSEMPKIEDDSAVIENIVDGAVEGLKNKVSGLESKIIGVNSLLKNAASTAALNNLYDKLKSEMPKVEDDSAVIENIVDSAVDSLKNKVVTLESKINGIDSTLKNAASSADLNKLYQQLKTEMPKIEDDSAVIENIVDGAVESLKNKVSGLESKIIGVNSLLKNAASTAALNNLYDKLKSEMPQVEDNSAAIESINQITAAVKNTQSELQKIQSTISELENANKSLAEKLSTVKDTASTGKADNSVKAVEERVAVIESNRQEWLTKLQQYQAVIVQWQNDFNTLQEQFNKQQEAIIKYNEAFEARQKQLDEYQKLFDSQNNVQTALSDQQTKFEGYRNALIDLEGRIKNIESRQQKEPVIREDLQNQKVSTTQEELTIQKESTISENLTAQKEYAIREEAPTSKEPVFREGFSSQEVSVIPEESSVPKEPVFHEGLPIQKVQAIPEESIVPKKPIVIEGLTPRDFNVKKNGKILFSNGVKQAIRQLRIAESLSYITAFLASSQYNKKRVFIDIVNNYKQSLNKIENNLTHKKFNENNISQELTEAFFTALSDNFLKPMIGTIYKDRSDNPEFYSKLLKKINEYLNACCVYTNLMEPQRVMNSADIENMEIINKNTTQEDDDKIIEEIERLPYNIDYLNRNGGVEHFCCKGKMVVLNFVEGDK